MIKSQDLTKNLFKDVITFDVDDTLILWSKPKNTPESIEINILDPRDGANNKVWIHTDHINFLKNQHQKGRTIVVWSQGGAEWVEAVVSALNLTEFVHIMMSKPFAFVDDLDSPHWMTNRVWIGNEPRLGSNSEKGKQDLDDLEDFDIF